MSLEQGRLQFQLEMVELQDRLIDSPPSASKAIPVVKLDASEAKYKTERAISSGVAIRFMAGTRYFARSHQFGDSEVSPVMATP